MRGDERIVDGVRIGAAGGGARVVERGDAGRLVGHAQGRHHAEIAERLHPNGGRENPLLDEPTLLASG